MAAIRFVNGRGGSGSYDVVRGNRLLGFVSHIEDENGRDVWEFDKLGSKKGTRGRSRMEAVRAGLSEGEKGA